MICTHPRKIFVYTLAEFVKNEYSSGNKDSSLGYFVGYKTENSFKSSPKKTRIEFQTETYLLTCLTKFLETSKLDPFTGCSALIIDEAHERRLSTDLLLCILKKEAYRWPDLKIIIISKLADTELISNYFGSCPTVEISSRKCPVHVIYQPFHNSSTVRAVVNKAIEIVKEIIYNDENINHILCFLTRQEEVEKAKEEFMKFNNYGNCEVLTLHEKMSPDELTKVLQIKERILLKVIFTTNIAETSLRIEGVHYVIDCGAIEEPVYDCKRKITSLEVNSS